MTFARPDPLSALGTPSGIPSWISSARAETPEDAAFFSGAALSQLHLVLECEAVPLALLRDRLALRAAAACVAFSGRPERTAELRDVVHLLRPGDLPGPAGETVWNGGGLRSGPSRSRRWPARCGAPRRARAAMVLEAVLSDAPRATTPALVLADAALAQSLGWPHLVPLLAAGVKRADLRKQGDDLRLACHRTLLASAVEAVRQAADLTRRAAHLKAVAPRLRAKGAGAAVEMFLTRDAVAPSALPLPDRAARRLCDRLVDLGAVRELTGRGTFRLYGV